MLSLTPNRAQVVQHHRKIVIPSRSVLLPILLTRKASPFQNGGSHAGNKLAMQEFMILPTGAEKFSEAMRMGAEVYQVLKVILRSSSSRHLCCPDFSFSALVFRSPPAFFSSSCVVTRLQVLFS